MGLHGFDSCVLEVKALGGTTLASECQTALACMSFEVQTGATAWSLDRGVAANVRKTTQPAS